MCSYCKLGEEIYNNHWQVQVWIDEDKLNIQTKGIDKIKINYCPMCGENVSKMETTTEVEE